MKLKLSLITLAASLFFIGASALAQKNDIAETFTGQIMNDKCISHKEMTTQAGIDEAKECTEKSAQAGAKYVLYDPKTTYELADQKDQKKAAEFAGQNVTLIGYLEVSSRAIQISEITPHS